MALAALRAGADAYFAKEVGDRADRDSADYFGRFHRLMSALPRIEHPARRAWRRFQPLERRLESFESRHREVGSPLRAAAFFRMAYFFCTAPRADAEGNPLCDTRYRVFFGEPALAARLCLHMCVRILGAQVLGWNDNGHDPEKGWVAQLEQRWPDHLTGEEWAFLHDAADPNWRHKIHMTNVDVAVWLPAAVKLMEAVLATEPGAATPAALPPVVLRPKTTGTPGSHGVRRAAAFAALRRGLDAVIPFQACCPIVLVDDEPEAWQQILRVLCGVTPQTLLPSGDPAAVLRAIAERGDPRPLVVLDLDWQGDRGRSALETLLQLKLEQPWIPVLVASALNDSLSVQRALYRGASGYFLLGPETDATAAVMRLRLVLQWVTALASPGYPLHRIWARMDSVAKEIRRAFPEHGDLCMDALRMAVYCSWPDYNPAEVWRHRRLLDVTESRQSPMLNRMFFAMAFRGFEHLWHIQPPSSDDDDYRWLVHARINALKYRSLGQYRDVLPAEYLTRLLDKLSYVCEMRTQRRRRK
jgi:CheY-like chemotaxis protein